MRVWDYKYALVNDVLDQAVSELRAVVLTERGHSDAELQLEADRCRTDRERQAHRLQPILDRFR